MKLQFWAQIVEVISDLVHKVSQNLSDYKLAYFDASHAKEVAKYSFQNILFIIKEICK